MAVQNSEILTTDLDNFVVKEGAESQTIIGNVIFAGDVEAYSFDAVSSKNYKENIEDTKDLNATNLIKNVDIVKFNYINDKSKTPKIGFIAENTDSLLSTPQQNRMDVTNCIGLLLKTIQELTERIEKLEEK